nr:TBC1 domain family member 3B-like isoform X2 [Oryctolagus cuniculus]
MEEMKEQDRLGASHFHHIDSAITWTFRNHLIFQERYRMNQCTLFQVLMEYSVYNPEVGYSQGLSHVVGLLLMFMPEEDFLWALVQLMENSKHTMHGRWMACGAQSMQVHARPSMAPECAGQCPGGGGSL